MPKCSSHRGGGGQSWGAGVLQGLLTQEEAKEVEYFFSLIDKCVEFVSAQLCCRLCLSNCQSALLSVRLPHISKLQGHLVVCMPVSVSVHQCV